MTPDLSQNSSNAAFVTRFGWKLLDEGPGHLHASAGLSVVLPELRARAVGPARARRARTPVDSSTIVNSKSMTPERTEQTFGVFGLELNDDEMRGIEKLEKLDASDRTGPDPDTFSGG